MSNNRYMMRGVSAAKEDVHNAIKNIDKGIFPQAFCKIIPDILGGDPEYCNIMHADGAGTKSSLAYMYWKETGALSVWKGIAQDAIVMNTDDLLCVGAVDNILVSSTIGRNKMLIPGEVISAIINGTDDLLHEMREMGIGIYPTGGETADVGDLVRTIIVDSTVTCRMKRSDVIDNANIRPGDVIVGDTLCIPTVFIAYTGESLDYKAPLLKALEAVHAVTCPQIRQLTLLDQLTDGMFGQPLDCFGAFLYGQHLHGIRLDLGYLFGIIGFDKFAQDIYELSDKLVLSVCCHSDLHSRYFPCFLSCLYVYSSTFFLVVLLYLYC